MSVQIDIERPELVQLGHDTTGEIWAPPFEKEHDTVMAEVDRQLHGIVCGMESTHTLQQMQDSLGTQSEMSAETVKLCEITLESIRVRLGMPVSTKVATESFSDKKVALEGIGSFLKAIWDAILNTFKRIWDAVVRLFGMAKDQRKSKAREDQLKKLNKVSDDKIPTKSEIIGGPADNFDHLGATFDVKAFQSWLYRFDDTVKAGVVIAKAYVKLVKSIDEHLVSSPEINLDEINGSYDEFNKSVQGSFHALRGSHHLSELNHLDERTGGKTLNVHSREVVCLDGFSRGRVFAAVPFLDKTGPILYSFQPLDADLKERKTMVTALVPGPTELKKLQESWNVFSKKTDDLADVIREATDLDTRENVLSKIQKYMDKEDGDLHRARQIQHIYVDMNIASSALVKLMVLVDESSLDVDDLLAAFVAQYPGN